MKHQNIVCCVINTVCYCSVAVAIHVLSKHEAQRRAKNEKYFRTWILKYVCVRSPICFKLLLYSGTNYRRYKQWFNYFYAKRLTNTCYTCYVRLKSISWFDSLLQQSTNTFLAKLCFPITSGSNKTSPLRLSVGWLVALFSIFSRGGYWIHDGKTTEGCDQWGLRFLRFIQSQKTMFIFVRFLVQIPGLNAICYAISSRMNLLNWKAVSFFINLLM